MRVTLEHKVDKQMIRAQIVNRIFFVWQIRLSEVKVIKSENLGELFTGSVWGRYGKQTYNIKKILDKWIISTLPMSKNNRDIQSHQTIVGSHL